VALLLLAGALVLATTGTGGFSSAAADRSVSVAVVGDEAAYLGVERDVVRVDGDPTLRVNVTNRFPSVETLNVTVSVGNHSETSDVTETHVFELAADCDAPVHVTADGPGTHVELTRPVPCDADSVGAGEVAEGEDEGEEAADEGEEAEQESDDDAGEEDGDEEAAEESADEGEEAETETTTASETDDDAADE
jgi:hypothetical protein